MSCSGMEKKLVLLVQLAEFLALGEELAHVNTQCFILALITPPPIFNSTRHAGIA